MNGIKLVIQFFIIFIVFFSSVEAQRLPEVIYKTNEASEDLFDYAMSGNGRLVKEKVNELKKLYTKYRKAAMDNKLTPQLLDFYSFYMDEINKALKNKQYLKIAFAANQITGIGSSFDNHFKTRIPGEIARLDYLGRELLLESQTGNVRAINRRLQDIDYIWKSVKPIILRKHGEKQSRKFENLVSGIKTAKYAPRSKEFTGDTERYLDQIDKLEKLF